MVTDTTPKGSDALRIARSIGYLIAALFIIAAVYYYFVPAQVPSAQGVFGCGTAGNQPTDGFAKGACQGTAQIFLFRTIAFAVAGILTAAGTYLLLRDPVDDEDLEAEVDSRPRRGSRAGTGAGTARRRTDERAGDEWEDDTSDARDGDLDPDDWDEVRPRRGSAGRPSPFDDEVDEPPSRGRRRRDDY